MGNPAGVKRDPGALEQRRRRAAEMLRAGVSQAEVARQVGVHRQSVSRWAKALAAQGLRGVRAAHRLGRPARLGAKEYRRIERALKEGPLSHGFNTNLWTLARVGAVIEKVTGVRYTPGHVWRVLRRLRWSCQMPTGRALERNQKAIESWKKETWPRVKKTR